jgi:ubiquinone/menaquinone biosynthesis C-methylase UbiE
VGDQLFGVNQAKTKAKTLLAKCHGRVVVELGAGRDQFGYSIPRLQEGTYVRTDVSLRELVQGRRRNRELGLDESRAELVVCDAHFLPFRPGQIDTFFFLNILHHLADRWEMIDEATKALKDHGALLCLEVDHPLQTIRTLVVHALLHRGIRGEPPEHFVTTELILGLFIRRGVKVEACSQTGCWKGRYNLVLGMKPGGVTA